MAQVVFPTSETPAITIVSVRGDLRLAGWDLSQFQAEASSEDDLTAEQVPEGVRLTCRSDVTVTVPRRASVTVQDVSGDVKARALDGRRRQYGGRCPRLRRPDRSEAGPAQVSAG